MKILHFFFTLSWLMTISLCAFSRNRIATEADRSIYGNYITPGDLIIDTPTKQNAGGSEVNYYFVSKQWPQLREGATVWFDGEKLGFLKIIKFSNSSSAIAGWHIERVRFKNIPSTRVVTEHLFCQGVKHFELDGESDLFPGIRALDNGKKFLTGNFGFHVISRIRQGHGYSISVTDGGTVTMKGFEVQHGFSGVRINHGDHDLTVAGIDISNFYIHDTGEGEGFYIGATHKPPFARISNLKIRNGIITRTAAEAIQVQHLVGGADIHNIVIRSADVRWMNAFMPGQDTGIQWSVDAGTNRMHHIIVDGFGSVGMVTFGSDTQPAPGRSQVSDIFFNDGLDIGMYLHKSAAYGIRWNFENVYYTGMNDDQNYARTGRPNRKFMISSRNGTDEYQFSGIYHDGSRMKVFQDTAHLQVEAPVTKALPEPEYINSGFTERASNIKQWHGSLAKYFPASQAGKVTVTTCWNKGDIAIETEGEYGFYLCTRTHESDGTRPAKNENFVKLTWDENGTRSDAANWQRSIKQSVFPPDDLRLVPGSYWDIAGYGIKK